MCTSFLLVFDFFIIQSIIQRMMKVNKLPKQDIKRGIEPPPTKPVKLNAHEKIIYNFSTMSSHYYRYIPKHDRIVNGKQESGCLVEKGLLNCNYSSPSISDQSRSSS